jgi:hypothetical protein
MLSKLLDLNDVPLSELAGNIQIADDIKVSVTGNPDAVGTAAFQSSI